MYSQYKEFQYYIMNGKTEPFFRSGGDIGFSWSVLYCKKRERGYFISDGYLRDYYIKSFTEGFDELFKKVGKEIYV